MFTWSDSSSLDEAEKPWKNGNSIVDLLTIYRKQKHANTDRPPEINLIQLRDKGLHSSSSTIRQWNMTAKSTPPRELASSFGNGRALTVTMLFVSCRTVAMKIATKVLSLGSNKKAAPARKPAGTACPSESRPQNRDRRQLTACKVSRGVVKDKALICIGFYQYASHTDHKMHAVSYKTSRRSPSCLSLIISSTRFPMPIRWSLWVHTLYISSRTRVYQSTH